jgi:hypothetical protein
MAKTMAKDRQPQLQRIGEALRLAADGADWNALGRHARALGPQLQALALLGPWTTAERTALARLRGQHDAAAGAAAQATRTLGARLDSMRANQEGWVAYAMHSETEPGTSQP